MHMHCLSRIVPLPALVAGPQALGRRSWGVRVAAPECPHCRAHRINHHGLAHGAPGSRVCPSAWASRRVALNLPPCTGPLHGRCHCLLLRRHYGMHGESSAIQHWWSWLAQGLLQRCWPTRLRINATHAISFSISAFSCVVSLTICRVLRG